jgi:hypothetical protein
MIMEKILVKMEKVEKMEKILAIFGENFSYYTCASQVPHDHAHGHPAPALPARLAVLPTLPKSMRCLCYPSPRSGPFLAHPVLQSPRECSSPLSSSQLR